MQLPAWKGDGVNEPQTNDVDLQLSFGTNYNGRTNKAGVGKEPTSVFDGGGELKGSECAE